MNKKLNEAYNNLSEKEQKSYNLIMAKIAKVMNQITNKTQREGVMKKFKDSLEKNNSVSNKVKKLTALAMSVLILASPVTLLTGCDKDGNIETEIPGSNITIETNKDGEVVNSVSDQLANSVYKDNSEKPIDFEYLSKLDAPFKYFDIQNVLDGGYINNVNNQIERWLNISDYCLMDVFDNPTINPMSEEQVKQYEEWVNSGEFYIVDYDARCTQNHLQASLIDELINTDSSYAFNMYLNSEVFSSDNSYQLIKDKDQTFCIVETKSDGTKLYNGYINNVAYTDILDGLSEYPLLTSEYNVLIQQVDGENATLWCQGVWCCLMSGGAILDKPSITFLGAPGKENGEDIEDVKVGDSDLSWRFGDSYLDIPQALETSNGITNYIRAMKVRINYKCLFDNGVKEVDAINNCKGVKGKISSIDFMLAYNGFSIGEKGNTTFISSDYKNTENDNVVLVGMVPTELENVQLPTTEAEAEK